MIRFLLTSLLVLRALYAPAQSDSLTIRDTIGVGRQRGGLQTTYGYQYYGASQLAASQLQTVLLRSPDASARMLTHRSGRLSLVTTGFLVGGVGLFVGSYLTGGRRSRTNGSLALAGTAALGGSIITQTVSGHQLERAIASHNAYLHARPEPYLPPVVYGARQPWMLSRADTIETRRAGLAYHYLYHGVPVYPGGQMSRLITSLSDHDVTEGVRYVGTINRIGGIVGGIGQGLLTGYVTTLLLTRRYRHATPLDNEFLTTSLLCLGANFVLTRHANRAQRRWLVRYNELIKQQFQDP